MGYYKYLCDMLKPLGIYDLDSGTGAHELIAEGLALDAILESLDTAERESNIMTALDYGLDMFETLLPARPVPDSLIDRREALAALIRIDGCSFTPDAINATLRGCGIAAVAHEINEPEKLEVSFPGVWGVPEDFEILRYRIEQILPCHLDVEYRFDYLSWEQIAVICASWSLLEGRFASWNELESGGYLLSG